MPSNSFSFAVFVSRKYDFIGLFHVFELADLLLGLGRHGVFWFKIMFNIRQALFGKSRTCPNEDSTT